MLTDKDKAKIHNAFNEKVIASLHSKTNWSTSLISHYKNCTKVVSPKRAIIIESIVGIPAEIMRPDIFKKRKAS